MNANCDKPIKSCQPLNRIIFRFFFCIPSLLCSRFSGWHGTLLLQLGAQAVNLFRRRKPKVYFCLKYLYSDELIGCVDLSDLDRGNLTKILVRYWAPQSLWGFCQTIFPVRSHWVTSENFQFPKQPIQISKKPRTLC